MKAILSLFICCYVLTCTAQEVDPTIQLAASYFQEAAAVSQNQHVWNTKIYGPTMFVDPGTRITYANEPDSAGLLKPQGGIFRGILPKEVTIANTAIVWGGRMWSIILWPLPMDHTERLSLIIHESFHRIQESIGLPERSPTISHLSTMNGRIYYLLELQALKAAISKPVNDRRSDLKNAMIFREKRHELFPDTFDKERILEMSEGLAEYTGVILGRQMRNIEQHLYGQIDTSGLRKSLIRSSAYITGPVYGYLLYEKRPEWTIGVDSNSDFPVLISELYEVDLPKRQVSNNTLASLEKQYNGTAIINSEKVKEKSRLEAVRAFTELFTRKPVLTIDLIKMNISFNPNNLFDMGELGTVYPTGEIRDIWGFLQVTNKGMLIKGWEKVSLSATSPFDPNSSTIGGNGWKLTLADNWKVVKIDDFHYKLSNELKGK